MLTERHHVTARHHSTAGKGEKTSHQKTIECLHVVHEREEAGSD